MNDLAIVILSFNTKDLTLKCLKSIFSKKWQAKYEVWVVDNASNDDSVKAIRKQFPQVNIIENEKNTGFSGGNNLVLKKANARYFMLLNSDTEVSTGALDGLVDFMDKSGYGIGSCKLVNKDGSFQPNAGDLPYGFALLVWLAGLDDVLFFLNGKLPAYHQQSKSYYVDGMEVGWVSGSVLVVKQEVIKKIGLLDDTIFMYAEDTDYCLRAKKAGFKVGWTDRVTIKHLGGASSKEPAFKQRVGEFKGLIYLYKKHYGFLSMLGLKALIYIFILVRMVAFFVVGRPQSSKVYAKVFASI